MPSDGGHRRKEAHFLRTKHGNCHRSARRARGKQRESKESTQPARELAGKAMPNIGAGEEGEEAKKKRLAGTVALVARTLAQAKHG